jgi:hypothetical protein
MCVVFKTLEKHIINKIETTQVLQKLEVENPFQKISKSESISF